jgi:hypothetical protein
MLYRTALQHPSGIGSNTDIVSDTGKGIGNDIGIATNTLRTSRVILLTCTALLAGHDGIGSNADIGSDTGKGISHDINIATNTSWTYQPKSDASQHCLAASQRNRQHH